jgi:hypothetical protein
VLDGLDGLRHGTFFGGHYDDHDVGHLGAACAHGGESLVAGRIQEHDVAGRRVDLVSADVLGDAAGLARGDVGLADGIEQRCLAVIDVPHHRDDRRARQPRSSGLSVSPSVMNSSSRKAVDSIW